MQVGPDGEGPVWRVTDGKATGTAAAGPGERDEGHQRGSARCPATAASPPGTWRGLSAAFVWQLRSGVVTKAEVKGVNSGDRGRM